MVPVWEPGAASEGITDTLSEAGVVPDGVTLSHAADERAVTGTLAPPPAVTETFCGAGAVPPGTLLKLSVAALRVRGVVTVSVTVTG